MSTEKGWGYAVIYRVEVPKDGMDSEALEKVTTELAKEIEKRMEGHLERMERMILGSIYKQPELTTGRRAVIAFDNKIT